MRLIILSFLIKIYKYLRVSLDQVPNLNINNQLCFVQQEISLLQPQSSSYGTQFHQQTQNPKERPIVIFHTYIYICSSNMNCQTVLSELCVTLFSSFGKSIRIDMAKIVEIELESLNNSFHYISFCLSLDFSQLTVSEGEETELLYQCLPTGIFWLVHPKLILYIHKKVCFTKQLYFPLIRFFLESQKRSIENETFMKKRFFCFFSYCLS